jgi:cellulose synthase (UDP-forming)
MNPKLVLSLWRERWGKAADAAVLIPYAQGMPNAWGRRVTQASIWSLPAASSIASVACIALIFWMLTVPYSLGGQVVFSFVLISFALFLRRYRGTLITLVLLGFSILVSSRYLYWRFSSTLGHQFDIDFVLGFVLCVAELHLIVLVAAAFTQKVLPLKRASSQLPKDQYKWPTVDVYVLVRGGEQEVVKKRCANALALVWPKGKKHVYLLDGLNRSSTEAIASSLGIPYVGLPPGIADPTEHIAQTLLRTKGELVAILDSEQAPEKSFLTMTAGWFVRNPTLGMLRTPKHLLGSDPLPKQLKLFQQHDHEISCAMLRRTLMVESESEDFGARNSDAGISHKWQMAGFGSGYIGFSEKADGETEIFRVDHQLTSKTLMWRQRLFAMQSLLQFYRPVAVFVFLTAPLAYFLLGANLIQTNLGLFAAFFLPHLLHLYFAHGRMSSSVRLEFWSDIRDTFLAGYILLPTTLSYFRTRVSQLWTGRLPNTTGSVDTTPWLGGKAHSAVLGLNFLGLLIGISQLLVYRDFDPVSGSFYLFWCTCNVLLLSSALAVSAEGKHIRMETGKLRHMHAMVRLPSGHTLACEANNFPEATLSLLLPTPLPTRIAPGGKLNVSIFCGDGEFNFPAFMVSLENQLLRVRIDEVALKRYQTTGTATLFRGPDWPKWLPGRNADQLLPRWVSKRIGMLLEKLSVGIGRLGNRIRMSPLGNLMERRKIKT